MLILIWLITIGSHPAVIAYSKGQPEIILKNITGKVTFAENGEALPGMSIMVKGNSTGTTTDGQENYSLAVPDEGGILGFSYIYRFCLTGRPRRK